MNASHIVDTINDLLEEIDRALPGPIDDELRKQVQDLPPSDLLHAEIELVYAKNQALSAIQAMSNAADILGLPPVEECEDFDDMDEWDFEESEGD